MLSAPLYLLALPYFYDWSRNGEGRALLKGVILTLAAASVHHVTLLFGSMLFGANSLFLSLAHAGQPKVEVVSGSFGSTDHARTVYTGRSTVSVIDGSGQELPAVPSGR